MMLRAGRPAYGPAVASFLRGRGTIRGLRAIRPGQCALQAPSLAVRRDTSSLSAPTSSSSPTDPSSDSLHEYTEEEDGEVVWVLERKGEGWAEEILPSLSVRRKPRSSDTSSPGKLKTDAHNRACALLLEVGVEEERVHKLLDDAASWRVTKKGRSLVDRKLRKRVLTNVPVLLELLVNGYSVPAPTVVDLLYQFPAVLSVDMEDDWASNYFEFLMRSKGLLQDHFDIEAVTARYRDYPSASIIAKLITPAKPLDEWVEWQLQMKQQGRLGEQRINLLEFAGMEWGVMDDEWEERFDEFVAFRLYYGDADVMRTGRTASAALQEWVEQQQSYYRQGTLPPKAIDRLQVLGLDLDPLPEEWLAQYNRLSNFRDTFGHCDVARSDDPDYQQLAEWVDQQRSLHSTAKLSDKRTALLQSLEMTWETENMHQEWNMRFEQLLAFGRKYGHVNVSRTWEEEPGLGRWLDAQQDEYRRNTLPDDRRKMLEDVGVVWGTVEDKWDELVAALEAYQKQYGHCDVPRRDERYPELSEFVAAQRQQWRTQTLPAQRMARLQELDFVFDQTQPEWERRYSELKAFHAEFGHCCVPQRWEPNLQLGMWVSQQRRLKRDEKLSVERHAMLDSLGFEWRGHRARHEREKHERAQQAKARARARVLQLEQDVEVVNPEPAQNPTLQQDGGGAEKVSKPPANDLIKTPMATNKRRIKVLSRQQEVSRKQ
mmetsp:Transcript_22792/g.49967  ORF Transcript_22792/g.49967 Transcript_22792/m.49967 type:complete len:713 (-) Transcript_22792:357-2495(-)|eukprot:CAMPEP_0118952454 /NCGR_PEP_ID=MMETSP1169-20130426/54865_1 /TAXON_ID=36882 /ORGANISM="Pyramimonas obovata, Strain CCMP722" /LENGTH=712 /DNA_ID=CAMNT_0006899711 /DNA_START=240 /DNA_END=2378 /DNA_ORIENTATION=-